MKKLLLCSAALFAAFTLNAQEVASVIREALPEEGKATIAEGTVVAQSEHVTVTLVDYAEEVGSTDCKANNYNKFVFDGQYELSTSGMTGSTNPKDGEGNSPAISFVAPVGGMAFNAEVSATGYIYICHKGTSNKQYTVFEEGTCVPYTWAQHTTADGLGTYTFTLPGIEEDGMVVYDQSKGTILKAEYYTFADPYSADNADTYKAGGLAVIEVPVYGTEAEPLNYVFNACGSKMSFCGIFFSPTKVSVAISGNEEAEDVMLLANGAVVTPPAAGGDVQVVTIDGKAWATAQGSADEGAEAFGPVAGGVVMCEIPGVAVMKNGAETNYKAVGTSQSGFNAIEVDSVVMDFSAVSAIQGQDNPKDEDGGTGWSTFKAPATGAFTTIEVSKNGYLAVVAKYSSNKNYTVFEEGTCIPYTLSMEWSAGGVEGVNPLTYTLPGVTDAEGITTYDTENGPIKWPEQIVLGDESEVKKNGVGVIMFQVFEGCSYNCNAWGSKIAPQGMFFSDKPFQSVVVKDVNGETADFTIYTAGASSIETIAAEPVKANIMFNLNGQKVGADYKGIVIMNGKKMILK